MTTKTVSFTRPANTTAYTAGDVIGRADGATAANAGPALLEFVGLDQLNTGELMITSAYARVDATSIPAGMTSLVAHLYASKPDSGLLDNAAWVKTSAVDKAAYRGSITLTPVVSGGDLWVASDGLNLHRKVTGESLFVYLVTTGGFTAGQNSTLVELSISAVSVTP